MARDLRAWQELAAEVPAVDVTHASAQLRKKLAGELAANDRRESNKELAMVAVRRPQELTMPLNRALKQLHRNTEIDVMDDKLTNNILKTMVETGAREIDGVGRAALLSRSVPNTAARVTDGPGS